MRYDIDFPVYFGVAIRLITEAISTCCYEIALSCGHEKDPKSPWHVVVICRTHFQPRLLTSVVTRALKVAAECNKILRKTAHFPRPFSLPTSMKVNRKQFAYFITFIFLITASGFSSIKHAIR